MSLSSTPRTWVSGEVVTAAEMNTEVRDAFTGIQAAWSSFTPSLTASTTNPTLGTGGTAVGNSLRIGALVHFRIVVTWGTGLTAGSGNYSVSLPGSSPVGQLAVNSSVYIRANATGNIFVGACHIFSTGNAARLTLGGTTVNPLVTNASPLAWAVSDTITVAGSMEG